MRLGFFSLLFLLHAVAAASRNNTSASVPVAKTTQPSPHKAPVPSTHHEALSAHCNHTFSTKNPAYHDHPSHLHKRDVQIQDLKLFQEAVSNFNWCHKSLLIPAGPMTGPYLASYGGNAALVKWFPHATDEEVSKEALHLQTVDQLYAWGYHEISPKKKYYYIFMKFMGYRGEVVSRWDPYFFSDPDNYRRLQDEAVLRYYWKYHVVNRHMNHFLVSFVYQKVDKQWRAEITDWEKVLFVREPLKPVGPPLSYTST